MSEENTMKHPTEKRTLWLSQVSSMPYRKRVELAPKNTFGWLIDYKNTRGACRIRTSVGSPPITASD